MKIQVIGVGIVGSTIANNILLKGRMCKIYLTDIDFRKLTGQYYDLLRVKRLEEKRTGKTYPELSKNAEPIEKGIDINIVCAGKPTDYDSYKDDETAHRKLLNINYPIVQKIVDKLDGRIIIVTNPAERITKLLRMEYPKKWIEHAGDKIDAIYPGKEIKALKGSTSWGIGTEVTNIVLEGMLTPPVPVLTLL